MGTCCFARLDCISIVESPCLVLVRQAFVRQGKTHAPDERTEAPVSVVASKLPKLELRGGHGVRTGRGEGVNFSCSYAVLKLRVVLYLLYVFSI